MELIDLRSDTVTRPDAGMLEAMCAAPLGDDVFGDDPTVNRLEETSAELLGKDSALFVPSGTMGNTIAIAVAARPGDEMIVEAGAHSYGFEVAGAARLWGVQAHPLHGERGVVPLEDIRRAVRPENIHLPRSSLVILEQTSNLGGGSILPLPYLEDVRDLCREHGLHFHLDGARLFNAAVASGVRVHAYAACVDTVMFCVSKGLGAPAGSLLVGPAVFIKEARRVRKLLGGGMRQGGILAACGLYALENNVTRLKEDHAHARRLAEAIQGGVRQAGVEGVEVDPPETNMVYVRFSGDGAAPLQTLLARLEAEGILAVDILGEALRFVFHKDVPNERVPEICATVTRALTGTK